MCSHAMWTHQSASQSVRQRYGGKKQPSYNLPPPVSRRLIISLSNPSVSLCAKPCNPIQQPWENVAFWPVQETECFTVWPPLCLSGICQLSSVSLNPSDPADPRGEAVRFNNNRPLICADLSCVWVCIKKNGNLRVNIESNWPKYSLSQGTAFTLNSRKQMRSFHFLGQLY